MAKVEVVLNSLPTSGGDGPHSYSKNSELQRKTASLVKETIDGVIMEKLDVQTLISRSNNTFYIADLGCATGPNTFYHVENILKAVKTNLESKSPNSLSPEFLVFFNDLPSNDFNTLFTTLPEKRSYFPVGVPGSFYNRVLPESSVHFALTFSALHWLSRVPPELLDRSSEAWNGGRVHYTSAPEEVFRAYEDQFGRDMEVFLEARAKEVVSGGLLVVGLCGIPRGMPFSNLAAGVMYELMATVLIEMQSEGLVTEDQVNSFNLPIYAATPEEISGLVEKNGCFTIERMELTNPAPWLKGPMTLAGVREWTACVRAAMGSLFVAHFGDHLVGDIFERLTGKLSDVTDRLDASYREKIALFFVLKRK